MDAPAQQKNLDISQELDFCRPQRDRGPPSTLREARPVRLEEPPEERGGDGVPRLKDRVRDAFGRQAA